MASPKTRKPTERKTTRAVRPNPTTPPPAKSGPGKKIAAALVAAALIGFFAWTILHHADEGPNIPLPRLAAACQLGASYDQVKKMLPKIDLRTYNNDPDFKIATLKPTDGLPDNLVGLDLIFFKQTLFFVSQQWEKTDPQKDPDAWSTQFRRWKKEGSGVLQSLGGNATLREWSFLDPSTEMIIRELKYNNKTEYWQDLRDAANAEGQRAFAKHRIDA